ncbi:MAG: hypothetical protein RIB03_01110 [Henriciella sp.]|uniref:hypothetical protein n=1 Tax=Henriciella sp. TaxID=1968823 RepID=UPI0032EEE3BB
MTEPTSEALSYILTWFGVFIIGEAVASIVFGFIRAIHARQKFRLQRHAYHRESRSGPVFVLHIDIDWMKGLLERTVMSIGLLAGFVHVLTFFGALKIATGLNQRAAEKDAPTHGWGMDYFLVGNLVSALFAILYVLVVRLVQPCVLSLLA